MFAVGVGFGVGVTAGVCVGLAVWGGGLAAVFGNGGGDWSVGCVPVEGLPPVPRLVPWLVPGADCEGPAGVLPVVPLPVLPLLELLLPGFLSSGGFAMVTPLEARFFVTDAMRI